MVLEEELQDKLQNNNIRVSENITSLVEGKVHNGTENNNVNDDKSIQNIGEEEINCKIIL